MRFLTRRFIGEYASSAGELGRDGKRDGGRDGDRDGGMESSLATPQALIWWRNGVKPRCGRTLGVSPSVMGERSWWVQALGMGKGRAGFRGRDRPEGQRGEPGKAAGDGQRTGLRGWVTLSSIREMETAKE